MFCYASLLVETGMVDEVNLSFLVVGHTHCNLDQEFSVHSKKITSSAWIGSPLAMQELYLNAHKESELLNVSSDDPDPEPVRRKTLSFQLQYLYDWKSFFKSIVNKTIKYYQVPHRFRIKLIRNVAVCQYMLFTDETYKEQWLPLEPSSAKTATTDPLLEQGCIQLKELAVINGLPNLHRYMSLKGDITTYVGTSKSSASGTTLNLANTINSLMEDMLELDKIALAGQIVNMEYQGDGYGLDNDDPSTAVSARDQKARIMKVKAEIQRELANTSTTKGGYLIWLDYSRDQNWDPLSRPRILPNLPAYGQKGDEAFKKIIDSARNIASVANAMLQRVTNAGVAVSISMSESIQDATEDYSTLVLHPKEEQWYNERRTCEDVIAKSKCFYYVLLKFYHRAHYIIMPLVRAIQDEVLGKDWQLMPRPSVDLSDSTKAAAFIERASQISAAMRTGISQLTRKHQAVQGEVLSRPGLSLQSQSVRCIFGMGSSSDVEGCLETANITCQTCQAICCDFHQVHDLHKDFSSEAAIFKQQAAVAQQKLSAPAVAPAKETESNGGDGGAKKIRKNTWADLLQRYECIKGKAYEKPVGQKVGDFQLMVEGLEGRLSAKREPAQSKIQPLVLATTESKPQPALITTGNLAGTTEVGSFEEFQQYQAFLAMKNRSALVIQHQADSKSQNSNVNGRDVASDDDNDDENFI